MGCDGAVLITGANGFVGEVLTKALRVRGISVCAAVRGPRRLVAKMGVHEIDVGDIGPKTCWSQALEGIRSVIHLAGRTHVTHEKSNNPLPLYRHINVEGTRRLAEEAARMGVGRFIFVSSVKVNGESTRDGQPFRECDHPAPEDPYGISKLEAEMALRAVLGGTGTEWVIVRPPLVHGPGVRANLEALMKAVIRGIPLPLARVDNRRSLIGVNNLTNFLLHCLDHPSAGGKVFLVSDGEDISVSELVRRLALFAGRPSRSVPVPTRVLLGAGRLLRRNPQVEKLVSSLQVDISFARQELGWAPPQTLDAGLREMVTHCLKGISSREFPG